MKKGELTTQQIVTLIILITSFVIILYFVFRLDLGNESADDLCHNSVLLRGSAITSKDSIPFECERSYVCLSKDKTCEKMTNPDILKVDDEEDVYFYLAEEMGDCWWMFGEGKVDYLSSDLKENLYCSFCSQVAFDDSLNDFSIDQEKLYNYLENHNYSEGLTYANYLYEGKFEEIKNHLEEENIQFGKRINLESQYFVMMGSYSRVGKLSWKALGTGAGLILGTVLTAINPPAGLAALKAVFILGSGTAGFLGGTYTASVIEGKSGNYYIPPILIEINSDALASLDCKDVSTSS